MANSISPLMAHAGYTDLEAYKNAKSNYIYSSKTANVGIKEKPEVKNYIKFSSTDIFTASLNAYTWDGTIYYSLDGETWVEYTDEHYSDLENINTLYLRGLGNTKFFYLDDGEVFTPISILNVSNVSCEGNIESLLDYEKVANEEHPEMGEHCFWSFFSNIFNLISAPELPATTLSMGCYEGMFVGQKSLTTPPKLPATTLAENCYNRMFYDCTSLTVLPKLPATTLVDTCYGSMFYGCTSIKLSETQTGEYQIPYRIPYSEEGADPTSGTSMQSMFRSTGGTFTDDPTVNTIYYTSNTVI